MRSKDDWASMAAVDLAVETGRLEHREPRPVHLVVSWLYASVVGAYARSMLLQRHDVEREALAVLLVEGVGPGRRVAGGRQLGLLLEVGANFASCQAPDAFGAPRGMHKLSPPSKNGRCRRPARTERE